MRGVILLVLAIAVPILIQAVGGRETPIDHPGAAAAILDRNNPGEHDVETVHAHEPRLVLLRGADRWHGKTSVAPPQGVSATRIEVLDPAGDLLAWRDLIPGGTATLEFSLPLGASGQVVARVAYDNGEVWGFSAEL